MNEIIKKGTLNRQISCTEMNKNSSRSHAMMTVKIETKKLQGGTSKIKTSSFHIIDLAGSERVKRTGARGNTLKEAGSINSSLFTLGNVINSLVEIDQGKKRFVKYRESKLAYLLKNSIEGNAKTLMIANISSSSCSYFEAFSTLKFAQRAKMIKNNAVINEDPSGTVTEMEKEIRKLKVKIHDLELERASWLCDLGEDESKYLTPRKKKRVSEALSEKKEFNKYMKNQQRMLFEILSPPAVSELGPEELSGDAKLVRRVKKLQKLIKLHLEQSIQKDKLYEQEIEKKDVQILKLEKIIEEYDKLSKKDQMLISSRDKTIAQLKDSTGFSLEDFRNHQIDLLSKEKESLEYKISNNPELEAFKSKCSKLENLIEEMNGG